MLGESKRKFDAFDCSYVFRRHLVYFNKIIKKLDH